MKKKTNGILVVLVLIVLYKEEETMDEFMKSILSRVLSEEIGKQQYWGFVEEKEYGTDPSNREDNARRIRQFMTDNDIEFREDFYLTARSGG